jgi:hypothetical protein
MNEWCDPPSDSSSKQCFVISWLQFKYILESLDSCRACRPKLSYLSSQGTTFVQSFIVMIMSYYNPVVDFMTSVKAKMMSNQKRVVRHFIRVS